MDIRNIKTIGALKKSGYVSRSVKEEIRDNLVKKLRAHENSFTGIIGYEETVIPDVERALLSKHNILFLGLRGQAKTRMARQMTELLDDYLPIIKICLLGFFLLLRMSMASSRPATVLV